jgi:TolB-like protein
MTRHPVRASERCATRRCVGRQRAALSIALLLLVPTGCATMGPVPPTAAEIPALEARVARDSMDIPARVRLAEAHRRAGDAEVARLLLEPIVVHEPVAGFHLGLVMEDLGRLADARRIYTSYLENGRSEELKRQVRARLVLLERRELEYAVRSALAREQELAGVTPSPQTVGVFPFLAVTEDPELRPLGTALAEMLTTDLAQTDRLRVLERTQVQSLLQELQLAESGRVDPVTAARSGRLLGAGNIVQGRVEAPGGDLAVQAVVVRVPMPEGAALTPVREQDALARIFDLQKRIALSIYEQMGVQLTAAERQRVTQHATQNVQALLAFGFGLEAADAGNHQAAAAHFRRAVALDPSFTMAAARAQQSEQLLRASLTLPDVLVRLGLAEAGPLVDFRALFAPVEAMVPDPNVRDAAAEALGTEGTTRRGTADIIIRRPGGQP